MQNRTKMMRGGFTLIELLVVIAIIGLLSSIVFASINNSKKRTRDTQRILGLKEVQKALELYYADNGKYPTPYVSPSGGAGAWRSGSNCWDCSAAEFYDPDKLLALAPYLIVRPSDPYLSNPVYYGYWYKSNGRDYKLAVVGIEAPSSAPITMQDSEFLGFWGLSIYSSSVSRGWQYFTAVCAVGTWGTNCVPI